MSGGVGWALLGERERKKLESWQRYHEANPQVYDWAIRLCRQWRSRGRDQWSPMALMYVMRWEHRLRAEDPDQRGFKLSNTDATFYSRLIMGLMPEVGTGEREFWRCCEHAHDAHPERLCRRCLGLGPRAFGFRTIEPAHDFAVGIFECKSAMVDTRWARRWPEPER